MTDNTSNTACTFIRPSVGACVIMNGKNMGIVIAESHAPYIDGDRVVHGKYQVHFACGIECVGGEVLEVKDMKELLDSHSEQKQEEDMHVSKFDDGVTPFEERFALFFDGCIQIYKDYMAVHFPNMAHEEFRVNKGRRYMKVIRGGSVHCFVDRTNGNVLKAASWSAPAKHARGNIMNDDNGLNCMGEYGAAYMR
jgi:hypothetical protein